jgi:hypothetical protein
VCGSALSKGLATDKALAISGDKEESKTRLSNMSPSMGSRMRTYT